MLLHCKSRAVGTRVYAELQEAVRGVRPLKKIKGFREKAVNPILNQKPYEEHELLWNQAQSDTQKYGVALPENVSDFGTRNLSIA